MPSMAGLTNISGGIFIPTTDPSPCLGTGSVCKWDTVSLSPPLLLGAGGSTGSLCSAMGALEVSGVSWRGVCGARVSVGDWRLLSS